MKIITIWYTVAGIPSSGVCGFVLYVVGVWEWRQELNRLKLNRLFLSEMIWIMRKPRSGPGTITNTDWIQ